MSYARKLRGTTQNIFLIETIITGKVYEREYVVMGSTGNIYNVLIANTPSCTCPDHMTRGNRCKHIYFILLRVMKINEDDEDQDEYSNDELLNMFNNIPNITKNLIVDDHKKECYDKLKHNKQLNKKDDKKEVKQRGTDDLCPICLDDLENGDELDYCKYSCGKAVHKICYGMWTKKKASNCIFCQASWTAVDKEKELQYLNLNSL